MIYEVIGKRCSTHNPAENLLLRKMTDKEAEVYAKQGIARGAVYACRHGCGTIVSWLFMNQSVETAKWALKERYHLEEYSGEWEGTK